MSSYAALLSAIALAMGYLLGSIPFGLVLTRAAGLGDIRTVGSGNIGATNVLRTGHKALAALTLAGDLLKGTVAVLIADLFLGQMPALAAGLGAFLGHLFPIWLNFKGGKGVATYIGVALGFAWPIALVFALVWLVVALLTRYSSLAALIASIVAPIATLTLPQSSFVVTPAPGALILALMTGLVLIRHRPNIERLLAGTESKIGSKG